MPRSSGRGVEVIASPRLNSGLLDEPVGGYSGGAPEGAKRIGEWSQGVCGDMSTGTRTLLFALRTPISLFINGHAAAGCGYCCCPCCCGAPEAVRAIGNHLARTGGIATCNMFPCLWTREIGNMKGDLTCEVAASGSCCYVCCPCIFISSNRDVFVQRHKLDGGCCENCASELSCSVSNGFAHDGFAVCVTQAASAAACRASRCGRWRRTPS